MKITDEMIEAGLLTVKNNYRPLVSAGQSIDERKLVERVLTAALSASPAGVVKPLEWRHDGSRYYAYCGVTDTTWTAENQEGRDRAEQTRAARIMSAIEPAGVGVETPAPSPRVEASEWTDEDRAKAWRDAFDAMHQRAMRAEKCIRDNWLGGYWRSVDFSQANEVRIILADAPLATTEGSNANT